MIRKDSRIDLLIELLNKYEETLNTWLHWRIDEKYWMLWRWINLMWVEQFLISKHYWFIKWLWDNEYIDYTEVIRNKWDWWFSNEMISLDEKRYCEILMLLSISEDPIRLLIYILM